MKHPRTAILLAVVLGSCGSKTAAPPTKPASSSPDLIKPVAAPVQLGKSVLRDLRKQTKAADQRKRDFDAMTGAGR